MKACLFHFKYYFFRIYDRKKKKKNTNAPVTAGKDDKKSAPVNPTYPYAPLAILVGVPAVEVNPTTIAAELTPALLKLIEVTADDEFTALLPVQFPTVPTERPVGAVLICTGKLKGAITVVVDGAKPPP
jgi:hypothetical protein